LSLGLPALHIAPFFLYKVYNAAEIDDVDSQEQYYEVPHWMHLSFVSYESDENVFVDHLLEMEEPKDGLEIAANGFLLPRSKVVRWSQVFPLGEVEFKQHSGPNWKSLTAPAALPVVIDYFPRQDEIDRGYTVSM
jgi:hypothetical protein